MAFNPFNAFRKHQKVIFAILTIICMIVFILQFGSGDIFSKFGIGRQQGKGDKVATLYGRDVYASDLEHTRQARQTANQFILHALEEGAKTASKEAQDYKPEKADAMDPLTTIRDSWKSRGQFPQQIQNAVNQGFFPPEQAMKQLQLFARQSVPQILQDYDTLAHVEKGLAASETTDKDKADEQRKLIANLRLLLKLQFNAMSPHTDSPFYFGGGVKPADLLDFEIWKRQADKLGVVLTKADVRRALAHEAGDHDLPNDPGAFWSSEPGFKEFFEKNKQLQEDRDVTPAVIDEFRVLIAKDLLAGKTDGIPALDDSNRIPPDPVSPYDFWKYYRDNRTTLKVAFLPIPVESFVSKVEGKPTTQELRDLFEEYKSREPAPNVPEPGFKEPRRMKIEYVTINTESPYYKTLTLTKAMNPESAALYLTSAWGQHTAGGGVAPLAALCEFLQHDPIQTDYDFDYVENNRPLLTSAPALFSLGWNPAPSFGVAAVSLQVDQENDKNARLRLASAGFLSALDGAAGATMFPGISLPTASIPKIPTHAESVIRLLEKRQKEAAARIVPEDVGAFSLELDKLKSKPAEAEAAIQKAAKERGWEYQDKAGLDDIYQLEADENLRALKEFMHPLPQDDKGRERSFAEVMFGMTASPYELRGPMGAGPDKPDMKDKKIVFWRSEDKHPHELTFEEARERVEKAWTFQQARILALQAANKIDNGVRAEAPIEAVRSLKDAGKYLKDSKLEGVKLGADFELADVARLLQPLTTSAGITRYQRYVIPAGLIPYAPPDLLDRLLTLDKPGKTLLFKDLPATHFYVAVLDERDDVKFNEAKKDKKFIDAYEEAGPQIGRFQDEQLWSRFFLADRQAQFHEALMRQLREDAAGASQVDDKGQLILSGRAGQPKASPQTPSEPIDFGGGDFGS